MNKDRIYQFAPHVKYRIDNGIILICNCKQLVDYEISLRFAPILEQISMKKPLDITNTSNRLLIGDLLATEMIIDNKTPQKPSPLIDIWGNLRFKEEEIM